VNSGSTTCLSFFEINATSFFFRGNTFLRISYTLCVIVSTWGPYFPLISLFHSIPHAIPDYALFIWFRELGSLVNS
jgi:hypothetical protein